MPQKWDGQRLIKRRKIHLPRARAIAMNLVGMANYGFSINQVRIPADKAATMQQPAVVEDSHSFFGRPGRLAPRWLVDLFNGSLADSEADDGDLFRRCADLPDRLTATEASPAFHDLLMIETQSVGSEKISCMCKHCKYHFWFCFYQDSPVTCATPSGNAGHNNSKSQFCHLVLETSTKATLPPDQKFLPLTSSASWHCSSNQCSFKVNVLMTKPRMKREHISILMDEKRIEKQRANALASDPERFQGLTSNLEKTALGTLNAYLRDCTNKPQSKAPEKIAWRNKRFFVQFGESCSEIFEYLGFRKGQIEDENYWFLPELAYYDQDKTVINSHRAFLEDARSEIQGLIEEVQGPQKEQPISATARLQHALLCQNSKLIDGKADEQNAFKLLGTLSFPEEVIKYAYHCQIQTDPANRKLYCGALQQLASTRSTDLQIFAAQEASLVDQVEMSPDEPLVQAYSHFNLPSNCSYDDDFIMRQYKVFLEQARTQTAQHRRMLFLIGKFRQSQKIMAAAAADMSFEDACDFLALDPGVKAGMAPSVDSIATYVDMQIKEDGREPALCAAALDVIASHFKMEGIRSVARDVMSSAPNYGMDQSANQNPYEDSGMVDLSLPPGLDNLRNTCYLNSILQYFFTVTPVRELVLSYDPAQHGSVERDGLNEEVWLGREFVLELQALFRMLGSASTKFVKPQQRLANAAWLSPDKVTNASEKNKQPTPPPLPARPAPVPSATSSTQTTTVTVAPVDPVTEHSPAASIASSQTLINLPPESPYELMERDDVQEEPPLEEITAQPKSESQLTALIAALDQTEVVGTDQMDVEEVMGRCINHLRAAINPASVISANDAGHQRDIITDTFFITFANMRMARGAEKYNRSISHERWVTANPAVNGKVHLYEALDGYFDREIIGENLLSYTAIVTAPPIFHVCIQRSKVGGGKNANPVQIPDLLYLDRYMDAEEGTPMYLARKRGWNIKALLETMKIDDENNAAAKGNVPAQAPLPQPSPALEAQIESDDTAERFLAKEWTFIDENGVERSVDDSDLSSADDFPVPGSAEDVAVPELLSKKRKAGSEPVTENEPVNDRESQRAQLLAEYDGLFAGMEKERYRLHAVICHAGQTAKSGHYWVWIFDFSRGVWRKYNDTTVTERSEADSAAVLEELSNRGEPYYLAYVRDADKEELVAVPSRDVPPPVQQQTTTEDVVESQPREEMQIDLTGDDSPPPYHG